MPLPMWPCTLPLGTSTPRGVRGRKKTEKTKTRKFQSWVGGNKASKKGGNMLLIILHIIWFFVFLSFFFLLFSFFPIFCNPGVEVEVWGLRKKDFNTGISEGEAKRAGLYHAVTLCTDAEMPTRQQHHWRHSLPTRFAHRSWRFHSFRVDIRRLSVLRLPAASPTLCAHRAS